MHAIAGRDKILYDNIRQFCAYARGKGRQVMSISIKTLSGMTPGIRGGRANLETIRNARALSAEAVSHVMGYISTQNAAAQVWACGVGRGGDTLFVIIPRNDIERVVKSRFASLVWDDETENKKKGRNVGAYAPRVLAHGMATAMRAFEMCGLSPRSYTCGVAEARYSDIAKGTNGTRSDELEKMVAEWLASFDRVEKTCWTGRLVGGGYDYPTERGRMAASHYNADVHVEYVGGCAVNVEVKGFAGRMICPKNAREQFDL